MLQNLLYCIADPGIFTTFFLSGSLPYYRIFLLYLRGAFRQLLFSFRCLLFLFGSFRKSVFRDIGFERIGASETFRKVSGAFRMPSASDPEFKSRLRREAPFPEGGFHVQMSADRQFQPLPVPFQYQWRTLLHRQVRRVWVPYRSKKPGRKPSGQKIFDFGTSGKIRTGGIRVGGT